MDDGRNIIGRDEAEHMIKEAIDDYLPDEILAQILEVINDGEEFHVVDDEFLNSSEEDEFD